MASKTNRPTPTTWRAFDADPLGFGVSILRETYTEDVQRVMQSVRDHRVTLVRSANSVGKTHVAALIALWFRLAYPQAQVHLLAAPPIANLETKLWGELDKRLDRYPALWKGARRKYLQLAWNRLEFIRGIAIPQDANPAQIQASIAGSHAPAILYIVDEGDGVPRAVFDGIEQCMTGGHARLLILFNPREESGYLAEMEAEGRANVLELSAFRHPNVVEGVDRYPGAVDRATTVRRINEWSRPLTPDETPDGECFAVPPFLVGCSALSDSGHAYPPLPAGARRITDIRFSYMVLGQYNARGSERHIFNKPYLAGLLKEMLRRGEDGQFVHRAVQTVQPGAGRLRGYAEFYEQPVPGKRYVIGADVAYGSVKDATGVFDRDWSTMDVLDEQLNHVASYWGRQGCEPGDFGRDMAAMGCHYNEALIVCESNGPGDAALEELVRRQKYRHVYYRKPPGSARHGTLAEREQWGFHTSEDSKVMVDTALADAINEAALEIGTLRLRGTRAIKELMNYGLLDGGKRGALIGHDDHVRSLALAVYILKNEPRPDLSKLQPVAPAAFYGGGR